MRIRHILTAACLLWTSAAVAAPAEVTRVETGLGPRYLNAKGFSLYFYARDTAGVSACVDRCATAWPPLAAPAEAKDEGDWSVVTRSDGSKQWAFKSRPVYTFARDSGPGTTMGDGVQDVWRLAIDLMPRPISITFQGTMQGWVAATSNGAQLYVHDGETAAGKRVCTDTCLRSWRPAVAPAIAGPIGDWSTVAREDGVTQWAFRGAPLYTFTGPGDAPDAKQAKDWKVLLLQAAPSLPPFVKMGPSDYGDILTDENRMSLYSIANLKGAMKALCLEPCLQANWRPVIADAEAKPVGNWTIASGAHGERQWAYRGRLVFTHTRDRKPGEIEGDRFADGTGDFGWNVIQAATLTLETY